MTARIGYSVQTALGKQLAQATNLQQQARLAFARLRDELYNSMYGDPPDFAYLAGEIGCSEADAQFLFNLIDGANNALGAPAIKDLAKVDMGGPSYGA